MDPTTQAAENTPKRGLGPLARHVNREPGMTTTTTPKRLSRDARRELSRLDAELSQLSWHFARDPEGWLVAPLARTLHFLHRDLGARLFQAVTRRVLGALPALRQPSLPSTDVAAVVAELDRRAESMASHKLSELIRGLMNAYCAPFRTA